MLLSFVAILFMAFAVCASPVHYKETISVLVRTYLLMCTMSTPKVVFIRNKTLYQIPLESQTTGRYQSFAIEKHSICKRRKRL